MVGGVFPQCLGATGNPATQDSKDNTRDHKEDEHKENRLSFVKVQQLTHPSNHLSEKFTDLSKQGSNSRGSGLKTSSFHKIFYGNLSRTEQENQQGKNASKKDEITNFGDSKDTETVLQRQNFHQLMRPQIAFLIQVTVVTKTRTTSKAETQACGLRT